MYTLCSVMPGIVEGATLITSILQQCTALMSGQGLKIPKCAMQLLWSFGEFLASVFCALQSFVFYRHSSYRSKHLKYTRCSCCECLASAVQFLNSSGHCIHIWYFTKTCPTDARPGVKIPRDGRCNCCGQVSNISSLPSLHLTDIHCNALAQFCSPQARFQQMACF